MVLKCSTSAPHGAKDHFGRRANHLVNVPPKPLIYLRKRRITQVADEERPWLRGPISSDSSRDASSGGPSRSEAIRRVGVSSTWFVNAAAVYGELLLGSHGQLLSSDWDLV
jgi:hypothetical protein